MQEGGEQEQKDELPYDTYIAVGSQYTRKRQYENAMIMFTKASEMPEFDNRCRVARADCCLRMGQAKDALEDAKEALEREPEDTKALMLKAEALFAIGEFEWAMMSYHRGRHLRPDIKDFEKGVTKCTKAILNGVGQPGEVKMEQPPDTNFLREDAISVLRQKPGKKTTSRPAVGVMAQKVAALDSSRKKKVEKKVKDSPRTVRQLLGELYHDKEYLEGLLSKSSPLSKSSKKDELQSIVRDGLEFLDKQTDFWRRQQPMYSRKTDFAKRTKKKVAQLTTDQLTKMYLEALLVVDNAMLDGRSREAVRECEKFMQKLDKQSTLELPSKSELYASFQSSYGNALMDIGRMEDALEAHKTDLLVSQKKRNLEGESRAMDNIGRCHVRLGNHKEAIDIWQKKLRMDEIFKANMERAWLYHEIGRSYFELGMFEDSLAHGALTAGMMDSQEQDAMVWSLNAQVLMGQSLSRLDQLEESQQAFTTAMDLAQQLKEDLSIDAIQAALDDLVIRIFQRESGETPEEDGRAPPGDKFTSDGGRIADVREENIKAENSPRAPSSGEEYTGGIIHRLPEDYERPSSPDYSDSQVSDGENDNEDGPLLGDPRGKDPPAADPQVDDTQVDNPQVDGSLMDKEEDDVHPYTTVDDPPFDDSQADDAQVDDSQVDDPQVDDSQVDDPQGNDSQASP